MIVDRFVYFAYGLGLISERSIPGLIPLETSDQSIPHLHIQFENGNFAGEKDTGGEALWFESQFADENGNPAFKIWRGSNSGDFFVRYSQGLTFRVDAALTRIGVYCTQRGSEKETSLYLLGPVLGIVLRLRGLTCLHASAVEINGRAVAFAGGMGAGKSTTAAIFVKNGHGALTDDIVVLEKNCGSHFSVQPGYPYLNLLPDSMALLSNTISALPSAEGVAEKTKLMLVGKDQGFHNRALPLGAIYVLAGRSTGHSEIAIDSYSPQQALIALATNSYANTILDPTRRASEFSALGELVRSVPIRRLTAPAQWPETGSLYTALSDDAVSIMKLRGM